jgi:carnosine N-methyltransferase
VREWSDEGALERSQAFTPILEELQRLLPVNDHNRNRQRVLVPGAGLGRLPLEIAARGYACQGNEFSYFMLLASNFLLNHVEEPGSLRIHPFLEQTCNIVQSGDAMRGVSIPDACPGDMLGPRGGEGGGAPDFSMTAGEFLMVYADQSGCWDAVVTCFFLDTAPVVRWAGGRRVICGR